MKNAIRRFAACALALAFLATLDASSLVFSFNQGTGVQTSQVGGTISIDNPDYLSNANNVTSPAIYVVMLYHSPWGDALFECQADTNVTAGTYFVGDFYSMTGGSDCYAGIY